MVEKYLLLLALKFMGIEMDDVIQDSGKVVVYTLKLFYSCTVAESEASRLAPYECPNV